MKSITQPNQSTIQVTFEMTVEELKLLTEGIGNTSQTGRVNAGMTVQQAIVCGEFYWTALEACKAIGIK